jgi:hypothetical protein
LELQNLNEELIVSERNTFDFVRMSFVAGGISRQRWPSLLSDVFNKVLKPGGMVQSMEWDLTFRSQSQREDLLPNLQEWTRLYTSALDASARPEGRKLQRVSDIETFMQAARFEVSSSIVDVPIGEWPDSQHEQQVGRSSLENMASLIDTIATYAVVSRNVCELSAFKAIVEAAKEELSIEEAQPYLRLHVTWGKKPS